MDSGGPWGDSFVLPKPGKSINMMSNVCESKGRRGRKVSEDPPSPCKHTRRGPESVPVRRKCMLVPDGAAKNDEDKARDDMVGSIF